MHNMDKKSHTTISEPIKPHETPKAEKVRVRKPPSRNKYQIKLGKLRTLRERIAFEVSEPHEAFIKELLTNAYNALASAANEYERLFPQSKP